MGDVHTILQEELKLLARIRVHQGKTQAWNRGGSRPTSGRIDQGSRGSQTIWKGDLDLPVDRPGSASDGRPNRHTGARHEDSSKPNQRGMQFS